MTAPARYFASPAMYDVMYASMRHDGLYLEAARAARGRVLEVGCGNGHVMLPLLEAGVAMDGLDYDPPMLDDLRRRLAERGFEAGLTLGDMRDFTLPHRYPLILIPFNTFLHNLTAEDQLATLRCCREHLEPNGALMFDVFAPDPARMLEHDGVPRLQMEHPDPDGDGTVRVLNAITSDPVEQRMRVERRVERRDAVGGVRETLPFAFQLRWVWAAETELLLRTAGFQRWSVEAREPGADAHLRKATMAPGDTLLWTAWRE
jgi:SAM-dependent methyltransferase